MERAFLIVFLLSVLFFFVISFIRIILYFVFKSIVNKYRNLLNILKKRSNKKLDTKNNTNRYDKRLRDKEKEKKLDRVYKINQEEHILQQPTQTKIVGIVKPIGKWTQLILGQKVSYMMQQANALKQQTEHGYWQTMLNSHNTKNSKGFGRS